MGTFISRSPEDTAALGEQWGREALPGWFIGLSGELGAGKTQLVKGLARGLGCPGRVHSPTFALVNTYEGGRLPLVHLDLYRLETVQQIVSAGLEEYLRDAPRVTVIEWAERWFNTERGPAVSRPAAALQSRAGLAPARSASGAGILPVWGSASLLAAHDRPDACPTNGFRVYWRRVQIDTLSETERRIVYEDSGA